MVVELLIVLLVIWLSARLGGIDMGFAGGLDVLILMLVCGVKPGVIPSDVIEITMAVIAAITSMQIAGDSITGRPGQALATSSATLYHLTGTAGYLCHDTNGRSGARRLLHPASECRSCRTARRANFPTAVDCRACLTNRHHRLATLSGGDLFCLDT